MPIRTCPKSPPRSNSCSDKDSTLATDGHQPVAKAIKEALMSKVAESSVKTLIEARVKRIYGIVGDSLNQITDAIRRVCAP